MTKKHKCYAIQYRIVMYHEDILVAQSWTQAVQKLRENVGRPITVSPRKKKHDGRHTARRWLTGGKS